MKERLSVRNPRTGETDYWITPPSSDQLVDQCGRMREAQRSWAGAGLERRIEALQQWRRALMAEHDELIRWLVTDTGRRPESEVEFDLLTAGIDRWCRLAPDLLAEGDERSTSLPFIRLASELVPYPLVGVISPWNFPLLLSNIDTLPALLAGSAVIVKPSEVTPRFIRPLNETVGAVPGLAGVLKYVEGAGGTGARMVELVDLVCFTGSVETGRKVGEAAARQFIPACLELGGKDPAVVLPSANIESATSAILWGSVVNAGQSCLSIERVYVAETLFDGFVEMLVEKATRLKLAYPTLEDGQIGPIIDEKQAEVIDAHLRDAYEKGAVAHCGGVIEDLGGGLWCRPTVLTEVDHSMKVMREETFGPVVPVMAFASVDRAIELANETNYGLSAAVFAGTKEEARCVARRLEAGAISINDAGLSAVMHEGEKNAFKWSGMGGTRMGPAAMDRFLRKKAVLIKEESEPDPWWFDDLAGSSSR